MMTDDELRHLIEECDGQEHSYLHMPKLVEIARDALRFRFLEQRAFYVKEPVPATTIYWHHESGTPEPNTLREAIDADMEASR